MGEGTKESRDRPGLHACDSSVRRLLVAIYFLSDPEGLTSRADDAQLAVEADLNPVEVYLGIRCLRRLGLIEQILFPDSHPQRGRTLVLMDHPAAIWYLTETRKSLSG